MDHLHWRQRHAIVCDSTCLGHLGQFNTDRFISIGHIQRDVADIIMRDIMLNFANVNSALKLAETYRN